MTTETRSSSDRANDVQRAVEAEMAAIRETVAREVCAQLLPVLRALLRGEELFKVVLEV